MFKQGLKNLFNQGQRSFLPKVTQNSTKVNQRSISELTRLFNVKDKRLMQQIMGRNLKQRSDMFMQYFGKRNFSSRGGGSGFDRFLNGILSRLPDGNIGYLIIGLNTLFYFMYLIWPRYQMYSYLNNFTFSKFNLAALRLHTLFTCHFTHMSFLTYVLDSVILYLFCQNLMMMFGPLFLAKTVCMAMFVSSFLLFLQHQGQGIVRPFYGNDAIMRALIFTVIFQNPSASFYLLPLPIQIPAWAIAAVLLGLDFLSFNVAGFGGVSASYIMINYFV